MQTKIVISVKGGCIQAVHSSDSKINLVLIDYDNIEQGDKMIDEQEEAEKEIEGNQLFNIY